MQTTYRIVTTFNAARHQWGGEMLLTLIANLPPEIPISAIVERSDLIRTGCLSDRISLSEFNESCPKFTAFKKNLSRYAIEKSQVGFRFDVVRFAHKVFAISSAYDLMSEDVLIWMDSDISVFKPLELKTISRWLPEPYLFSYLGREHLTGDPAFCNAAYPECGYMMFRRDPVTEKFINRLLYLYVSNSFEKHSEWHDSYLIRDTLAEFQSSNQTFGFDICSLGLIPLTQKDHVFIASVLGGYMDHYKGNRKNTRISPELAERERFLQLIASSQNRNRI